MAGYGRGEDDPQPLRLPQGLPAQEGLRQVSERRRQEVLPAFIKGILDKETTKAFIDT